MDNEWDAIGSQPSRVPVLDPELIADLIVDLASAEWTVDRVEAMLSARARDALMRDQRVPALLDLRERTEPAALLTRLFVLGSTEDEIDVGEALPTIGAAGLAGLGLVKVSDGRANALFDLRPHEAALPAPVDVAAAQGPLEPNDPVTRAWWVLSDLGEASTGRPLAPDHVLGIGGATTSLLTLTIRDHVGSALDIGTGCGIQALYLATHADHVVATDLSERACAIARFNAALNGADIDVRQGSLFEPVATERFDLVVSNPPFVITPDSVRTSGLLEYRDGGMERDTLIATILSEVPDHLNPGGTAQMLANWEIPVGLDPDVEWSGRVDGWLRGLPVDAWVVQRDVLDPARYVEMWMRDSGDMLVARDEWEHTYADWLEDFDRAGVAAIGLGFIVVRALAAAGVGAREDGARAYVLELDAATPRGEDVVRALSAMGLPEDLSPLRLARADDVTEERHYTPGEPDPRVIMEHQGGGLGRSIPVGSEVAALVGVADGELSVAQIITAISALTGQQVGDLRERTVAAVRELIAAGMLEVVGRV